MDYLVETNGLTRVYGHHKAVNDLSIHVRQGDIYGFIGKNGAGKTTTLKMLCGMVRPTSGKMTIMGHTGSDRNKVLKKIGTLIEAPGLYPGLDAYKNMKIKCIAEGINKPGYIEDILKTVGLEGVGNKKTKNYSLGMKQRLGIGLALVGDPDILMLDEPINGLDPQGIIEVRDMITRLNKERNMTIIISSHILEELSKMATAYGIIDNGILLKELTKEQLQESSKEYIEIEIEDVDSAKAVLDEMGIKTYEIKDKTINVYDSSERFAEINFALADKRIMVKSIKTVTEDLEQFFMELTGGVQNV